MLALSRTAKHFAPILAVTTCLAACGAQGQTSAPAMPLTPVEASVRDGALRGYAEDGVRIFKGVPYAEAPVGDLRWRRRKRQRSGPACATPRPSAPTACRIAWVGTTPRPSFRSARTA
jgi:hypothetical protein